jgi:hypothetical protein
MEKKKLGSIMDIIDEIHGREFSALPIVQKRSSMNNFSIEEIKMRIKFHQEQSNKFHEIYNNEIYLLPPHITLDILMGSEKIRQICKDLTYELCIYHRNAKIKWELLLEKGGAEPVVGKH